MFRSGIVDAALARTTAYFFLGVYRTLVPFAERVSVPSEKSTVCLTPIDAFLGELTRGLYRRDFLARYLCGGESRVLDHQ